MVTLKNKLFCIKIIISLIIENYVNYKLQLSVNFQWCQNQECVPIAETPIAIDGGWGDWSDWSECSRSCGAGVSIQQRDCDHPKPASGGKFCIGERRRYRICNTKPCPDDQPTFRALQCSRFNNQTYNGKQYTWLPYFESGKWIRNILFCY